MTSSGLPPARMYCPTASAMPGSMIASGVRILASRVRSSSEFMAACMLGSGRAQCGAAATASSARAWRAAEGLLAGSTCSGHRSGCGDGGCDALVL